MPRKKRPVSSRHPTDAMARFERLLKAMAPRVAVPDGAAPKPLQTRGKKVPRELR